MFDGPKQTCEMTMTPSNTEYLPMELTVLPLGCAGIQVAKFTIPQSVTNGLASIVWYARGEAADLNHRSAC